MRNLSAICRSPVFLSVLCDLCVSKAGNNLLAINGGNVSSGGGDVVLTGIAVASGTRGIDVQYGGVTAGG